MCSAHPVKPLVVSWVAVWACHEIRGLLESQLGETRLTFPALLGCVGTRSVLSERGETLWRGEEWQVEEDAERDRMHAAMEGTTSEESASYDSSWS